jgi:hypothetical protein
MQRTPPQDSEHQVLPFRRRELLRKPRPQPRSAVPAPKLGKYEGSEAEDNYPRRMLVNVAGLAVTIALSIAGAWLVVHIADLRKHQDCVLSGRRNCTPIDGNLLQH